MKTLDERVNRIVNNCENYDEDIKRCCERLNVMRRGSLYDTKSIKYNPLKKDEGDEESQEGKGVIARL